MLASSHSNASGTPTELVLAAACASFRLTDGVYRKSTDFETDKKSSKKIMSECLQNDSILPCDRELAAEVRRWWSALVVTSLARNLSKIEIDGMNLADSDTVSGSKLGLAAWMPHGHAIALEKQKIEDIMYDSGRQWIGEFRQRVDLTVTVLESKWCEIWGRATNKAVVQNMGVVKFYSPAPLVTTNTYSIRGTVTRHEVDGFIKITKLNRVKISNHV